MKETATIYSFTRVFVAAEQFADKAPYYSAIVEKDDGERFPVFIINVADDKDIAIGRKVTFDSLDENGKKQYVIEKEGDE